MRRQDKADTRNRRSWLLMARLAWFGITILTLAVWAMAVAVDFAALRAWQPTPAEAGLLQQLNLSPSFYAYYVVGFKVLHMLVYVVVAGTLFWRKSDDRLAILTSAALVTGGAVTSWVLWSVNAGQFMLWWLSQLVQLAGWTSFGLMLYTFPDATLYPHWLRWLMVPWIPWLIFSLAYPSAPLSFQTGSGLSLIVVSFTLGVGVIAQAYRYKHVSTPAQRQQTKWVLFGFAASVSIVIISTVLRAAAPAIMNRNTSSGAIYNVFFIDLTWRIVYTIFPVTVAFAMLRYRLWDIDPIVNRTLVYGAMTAVVVSLYVLFVAAVGTLFRAQGSFGVSLLAAGLVAVLFQPLRERLQRGVNRLMYGERDDPYAVLARLGRQIEAVGTQEALLPQIAETIAQALRLPYVAIMLSREDISYTAAAFGQRVADPVTLPLVYQSEVIGQLALAPRSTRESFSAAEARLLRNIARQVGAAAHAVRLTHDLQRSRRRLITAREEERRRLRRDLHDGLGPTLAAVRLRVGTLRRLSQSDSEAADELVVELQADIREAISDIRRLVYELRPPTLDEYGLVGAIRAHAAQCVDRNSVDTERETIATEVCEPKFIIDAPERLPPLPAAVEVAVYRIVQEALTNVVRHAQARTCVVRLTLADGLNLTITDDGVGLPPARSVGVGLLSMRERAAELGGTCSFAEPAGGGTEVSVYLPLWKE